VILVDTGPLVAALAATDADHARCASFFNSFVGELLVTPYVVNEVCYLTERDMGSKAEAAFLRSLARGELLAHTPEREWSATSPSLRAGSRPRSRAAAPARTVPVSGYPY
jgi:predicted nucleic acid-binding protein